MVSMGEHCLAISKPSSYLENRHLNGQSHLPGHLLKGKLFITLLDFARVLSPRAVITLMTGQSQALLMAAPLARVLAERSGEFPSARV